MMGVGLRNGLNKETFFLTPFNGNDVYNQGMGAKVGVSVRLFSDK